MKKYFITLVAVIACISLFGQKWQEIGVKMNFPKGAPSFYSIGDLTVLNSTTIFGYGRSTFVASYDAGISWDTIPLSLGAGFHLHKIQFFDNKNGIASGDSLNSDPSGNSGSNPLLLKTADGGKTWQQLYLPSSLKNKSFTGGVLFISFKDSNDFLLGNSRIYGTRDLGKSWTPISITDSTVGPWSDGLNYSGDSTIFFSLHLKKKLYYSENYGKTWKIDSLSFIDSAKQKTMFNGITYFEPGKNIGFIVGSQTGTSGSTGPIFFTNNGGKKWNYHGGAYDFQLTQFSFSDSANGWMWTLNGINKIYRFQRLTDTTLRWNLDTAGLSVIKSGGPQILGMGGPNSGYMVSRIDSGSMRWYRLFRYGSVSQGSNTVSGRVYVDMNTNNIFDSLTDVKLSNVAVMVQPGNYFTTTDKNGNYSFNLDVGNYTFTFLKPTAYVNTMQYSVPTSGIFTLNLTAGGQNIPNKDFSVKPIKLNSILSVSVSSSARRLCFKNKTVINYRNDGFVTANNVKIALVLPIEVKLINSDKNYTIDAGGRYVFNVGTLGAFESGQIGIIDSILCNTKLLGRTACTEVYIYGDNIDYKTDTTAWDKSEVIVKARCMNGWINFQVINPTPNPMGDSAELRFLSNTTLKDKLKYKLGANDTLDFTIKANYTTWRVEADQRPGHPLSQYAQATIEGCEGEGAGNVSTGFVNKLPVNDFKYKKFVHCETIRGSYDPNDKTVYPEGLTTNNYVKPGTPLSYRVRFQNTGNDTAFKVVVKDTLDANFDLATFAFGGASHANTYKITGKGQPVLEVTFDNINLPDSTIDKLNSNGFFTYSVQHKTGITQGTKINNTAFIYFDFNSPIKTNTASTTIKDTSFVSISPVNPVTKFPFILKDYTKDSLCKGDTFNLAIIGEGPYNWYEIATPSTSLGTGYELQQIAQATATYIGKTKDGYDTIRVLVKNCTTSGPDAVNETTPNFVSVYPNPSQSGLFNVQYNENQPIVHLTVVDISGREIKQRGTTTIDLTAEKAGVYFLVIETEAGTKSYIKLLKQ